MKDKFRKRKGFWIAGQVLYPRGVVAMRRSLFPVGVNQYIHVRHLHGLFPPPSRKSQFVVKSIESRRPIQIQLRIYQLPCHRMQTEWC